MKAIVVVFMPTPDGQPVTDKVATGRTNISWRSGKGELSAGLQARRSEAAFLDVVHRESTLLRCVILPSPKGRVIRSVSF